jgi:ABC-2 type transport system permease protein
MNAFLAALWAETLKARRSKVTLLVTLAFALFPGVGGLFMLILKDPEAARDLGLISAKAELVAGSADWPALFGCWSSDVRRRHGSLFLRAAWLSGANADHTAKEILTVPTPRGAIVAAKFALAAAWMAILALMVFGLGLAAGAAVGLPGWSRGLAATSFGVLMGVAGLCYLLSSFVALGASAGHGYLPALGWAFFTLIAAQIVSVLGWGDWFPWAVPGLLTQAVGTEAAAGLGAHSYVVVALTAIAGAAATLRYWQRADQVR